jgi:REP element-mobilizing transposase RayT
VSQTSRSNVETAGDHGTFLRIDVLRIAATGFQHSRAPFARLATHWALRFNLDVNQPPQPRRPGPPHNPGVRDLVAGKRQFSSLPGQEEAKREFRGWHERGYLPHRDERGLTQFVTFRLADSFPESLRSEWEHLWCIEDNRDLRTELEAYLDRCRGECYLRQPDVAQIVETALRFFHGERYELRAWCVMPNHVHVLFKVSSVPMAEILESWKKHTAQKANRLLGRRGNLWELDYWDTYMRDAAHERKTVRYIESNPAKAKLVSDPEEWLWSSARFRDEVGRLRL